MLGSVADVMLRSTEPTPRGGYWAHTGPPTPVLATSFFLAGLGTVVLGPLLPVLLHEWALSDNRGGLLLLAKFVGAFVGGASVLQRLRLCVFAGHLLAAAGFAVFALSHGLGLALPALFLTGLGLGEIIASTNVLAGRLWPEHTGSALSLLNFFWSLGAVSTGLLAAALLPREGWRGPVLCLAALLAGAGLLTLLTGTRQIAMPDASPASGPGQQPRLPLRTGLVFGGLLFLYGGLETCLTGWLTTFSLRMAGGHVLGGQSGFVVLWAALTAGRVLASALMRRFPERAVQNASLLLSLLLTGALATTHSGRALAVVCILLGLSLAPVFPSIFALLLRHPVRPRTAGLILAVSGLGAAVFPWTMGWISTATGSLRVAMGVPAALAAAMLILASMERGERKFAPRST